MYTTFHIKAVELDENFLKKLKRMFGKKNISIIVEEELDETEYLLSTEANRKMLDKSLKEAKAGKLTKVNIDKLK
jgi:tRNA A37 methylthiotransferase MiaB